MNTVISCVEGISTLVAEGCIATRQFLNVALFTTASDFATLESAQSNYQSPIINTHLVITDDKLCDCMEHIIP
jgi:hypothetical protein